MILGIDDAQDFANATANEVALLDAFTFCAVASTRQELLIQHA